MFLIGQSVESFVCVECCCHPICEQGENNGNPIDFMHKRATVSILYWKIDQMFLAAYQDWPTVRTPLCLFQVFSPLWSKLDIRVLSTHPLNWLDLFFFLKLLSNCKGLAIVGAYFVRGLKEPDQFIWQFIPALKNQEHFNTQNIEKIHWNKKKKLIIMTFWDVRNNIWNRWYNRQPYRPYWHATNGMVC